MKQLTSFLIALFFILNQSYGQVPEFMNYQGVARDLSGSFIANKPIILQISIKKEFTNTEVYKETHLVTTNDLGLFNLKIGEGIINNGIFKDIDWGNGNYSLQVDLDETGDGVYQTIGSSIFSSVPYALYSKNGSKWKGNNNALYYNGNVGVGLTIPIRPIHVQSNNGVIQVDRNKSSPAIQFARFSDNTPFTIDNYEIGFGIGVDTRNNETGYLFFGEDINKEFSTGFGNGGVWLAIQKGGNVGIGTVNPKSKLQIANGDVFIEDVNSGVIMKSPNGNCWRMTVSDEGQPVFNTITCPN